MSTDYTQDANCQAAWLFAEGSGETIADSGVNANTGNFKGAGEPAWDTTDVPFAVSGSAPNSVVFDGANDYIDCGDDASLDINRNLTLIGWVNTDVINAYESIIGHGIGHWLLRLNNNGKLTFLDSNQAQILEATTPLTVTVWQHVALTLDNANPANIIIYLDGGSDGTTTTTRVFDGVYGVWFSGDVNPDRPVGEYFFDGKMTDFAVFDRVLDATEINEVMDYGLLGGAVGSSQKTFDGLAIASVKTVNGLAIASVNSYNGIA